MKMRIASLLICLSVLVHGQKASRLKVDNVHSVEAQVAKLAGPKSTFETTREYEARLQKFAATVGAVPYTFLLARTDRQGGYMFAYNADSAEMKVTLTPEYEGRAYKGPHGLPLKGDYGFVYDHVAVSR